MVRGYWKTQGKIPIGKEQERTLYTEPPETGDFCIVYDESIVSIDIDDYDHGTGELDNPVRGKPRSEAVIAYLEEHNIRYNGIRTENGVHLDFRKPIDLSIDGNKNAWYCPLGVEIEVKVTKAVELVVVNGVKRQCFKGSFTNEDIDELPPALWPIQKSRSKPFDMNFESGNRNNRISEYAFHLSNQGIQVEDIRSIIEGLNKYVVDEPLPEDEVALILRPETMEKLKYIEEKHRNGSASPEVFGKFLKSLGMSIRYNELLNIVEYENIPDKADYRDITDIQNVMPIKLTYEFRKFTGKSNITKHQVIDLILLEADTHSYNPVKQFLQSVEWDGKDRFPELFMVLGVTDEMHEVFIRKWFYQTAGMPFNTMEAPFQAEGVLILQGAEGIGKTRFFQSMAVNPMWFSSLDKELTTKNKDILIQMLSVWIAEIGEVDRTFKANKSDIKSFITSRDDTIRRPYRMEQVKKARTTSFCGTTNKTTFLSDDTGSRRWWIVPVNQKIRIGDFGRRENLIQFWAQCFHEYIMDSNCFRLTDDEMTVLKERNKQSMELVPAEEELRNRFDFDAPEADWKWSTASALKNLPEYDVEKYDVRQIGQALTIIQADERRIQKKRSKAGTIYLIPPAIMMTDRYRNRKES